MAKNCHPIVIDLADDNSISTIVLDDDEPVTIDDDDDSIVSVDSLNTTVASSRTVNINNDTFNTTAASLRNKHDVTLNTTVESPRNLNDVTLNTTVGSPRNLNDVTLNTTVESPRNEHDVTLNTTVESPRNLNDVTLNTTVGSPRKPPNDGNAVIIIDDGDKGNAFQSTNQLLKLRESYITRKVLASEDFIRFSNNNLYSKQLNFGGESVSNRFFNYRNPQVKSNVGNEELERFSSTNQQGKTEKSGDFEKKPLQGKSQVSGVSVENKDSSSDQSGKSEKSDLIGLDNRKQQPGTSKICEKSVENGDIVEVMDGEQPGKSNKSAGNEDIVEVMNGDQPGTSKISVDIDDDIVEVFDIQQPGTSKISVENGNLEEVLDILGIEASICKKLHNGQIKLESLDELLRSLKAHEAKLLGNVLQNLNGSGGGGSGDKGGGGSGDKGEGANGGGVVGRKNRLRRQRIDELLRTMDLEESRLLWSYLNSLKLSATGATNVRDEEGGGGGGGGEGRDVEGGKKNTDGEVKGEGGKESEKNDVKEEVDRKKVRGRKRRRPPQYIRRRNANKTDGEIMKKSKSDKCENGGKMENGEEGVKKNSGNDKTTNTESNEKENDRIEEEDDDDDVILVTSTETASTSQPSSSFTSSSFQTKLANECGNKEVADTVMDRPITHSAHLQEPRSGQNVGKKSKKNKKSWNASPNMKNKKLCKSSLNLKKKKKSAGTISSDRVRMALNNVQKSSNCAQTMTNLVQTPLNNAQKSSNRSQKPENWAQMNLNNAQKSNSSQKPENWAQMTLNNAQMSNSSQKPENWAQMTLNNAQMSNSSHKPESWAQMNLNNAQMSNSSQKPESWAQLASRINRCWSNCTQVSSNIGQTSTNSSQMLSNNNRQGSNAVPLFSNVVNKNMSNNNRHGLNGVPLFSNVVNQNMSNNNRHGLNGVPLFSNVVNQKMSNTNGHGSNAVPLFSNVVNQKMSNTNGHGSNAAPTLSNVPKTTSGDVIVIEDDRHVFNPSFDNQFSLAGKNVFIPSSMLPKTGPRPVFIDGCNVAFSHGRNSQFSVRGIEICVDYFRRLGNKTYVVLPNHRLCHLSDALANAWQRDGTLIVTPSRRINNTLVTSDDDRYVIQCAAAMDGIIVTKDQYRDHMGINRLWDVTIEKRLLMLSWIQDMLIFPDDPLGRQGPKLKDFLMY